ncbi:hypothetical protein [Clostridium akagii]|uniref:hypothetical protein n=1 Tax=Clostridium akagii TaxID=91623 RepID=UPI0012EC9425|nr:hypothetical protein [Clostridium akagii]
MKNNVVYVDFTHKKVSNKKNAFSLEQIKEHIKYLFYFIPNKFNKSNRSKQCKRIL